MLNIVESRKNICRGPSGPRSAARLAVLESATARKDPKRIIHSIQQTPKSAATQVMVYPGGGSYPNHRLIDCEEIWKGAGHACSFRLSVPGRSSIAHRSTLRRCGLLESKRALGSQREFQETRLVKKKPKHSQNQRAKQNNRSASPLPGQSAILHWSQVRHSMSLLGKMQIIYINIYKAKFNFEGILLTCFQR